MVLVSRDCSLSCPRGVVALILERVPPETEALDLERDSNVRRIGCSLVFPTSLRLRTRSLGSGLDSNEHRNGFSQVLFLPKKV